MGIETRDRARTANMRISTSKGNVSIVFMYELIRPPLKNFVSLILEPYLHELINLIIQHPSNISRREATSSRSSRGEILRNLICQIISGRA